MAENTENWTKLESDSRYPRKYKFEELENKVDNFQPLQSFVYKDTVDDYSALSSLTGLEVGDGYVNAEDGLVYVWNGTSFPAEGDGLDVAMKPVGVVEEGNEFAVSGGEVYDTISLFANIPNYIHFELYGGDGYYTESGNPRTSDNWISFRPIAINDAGGELFTLQGIDDSDYKSVKFYAESDTLNQTPYLIPIPSGVTTFSFNTPSGYTKMLGNVARGTNVSSQIPIYNENFKLIKGEQAKIKSETIIDDITSPQLTSIESDIDNLKNRPTFANYEGLGFPQYELGVDNDKYFDKASKRIFNKISGKWTPTSQTRYYPINVPTDFGWDIGRRIMYQENGKAFIEDWKGVFEEKVKSDYDRLTKYYVNPTSGSNSNDGLTPQTAVLTVEYAVDTLGARNVILANGVYAINNDVRMGLITDNDVTTEPLIIRCLDGKALMTRSYLGNAYTWTANGNCYQASRTNVLNVVDLSNLDENGYYNQPTEVESIEDCQSTPNSYYRTSSIIYVHTFDGRVPDENILLVFSGTTGYIAGQNVPYVYMENIDVINVNNSNAFVFRNNTTSQYDTKVYLKNCYSGNNSLGNGIAIDNIKEAILEGCTGAYNLRDALNYHTSLLSAGYESMKVLEIDCMGYETGTKWSGEYSSNGSTMHEGGTILRINGVFKKASGGVVADVNTGIRSMNIGVEASDTIWNDCFRVNGEESKMWVMAGVAYTSLPTGTSIKADNGAVAFYDDKTILLNPTSGDVSEI